MSKVAVGANVKPAKPRRLTLKQKRFIAEYLKNGGNGRQAALIAYPNQTSHSANVQATQNLNKPSIQAEIDKALQKHNATPDFAVGKIVEVANMEVDSKTAGSVLKASDTILELHGFRKGQNPSIGLQVNQFFGKSRTSKFVSNNTIDDIKP